MALGIINVPGAPRSGLEAAETQIEALREKLLGKGGVLEALSAHTSSGENPHKVTAQQVGAIASTDKGAAGGVASLDANGKVPAAQLPSMNYIPTSQKGSAGGVPTLDANGKVPESQLPVQGGHIAQAAPPDNTKFGWIDTANGNVLKYYDGSKWATVSAVWG